MLVMLWHEIVCWFQKIYQDLKRFEAEHRIVIILTFRCAKQFYDPNMQEQSKAGKKSEINKQTFVIWWLNSRRYRSVWYLFSCTESDNVAVLAQLTEFTEQLMSLTAPVPSQGLRTHQLSAIGDHVVTFFQLSLSADHNFSDFAQKLSRLSRDS